MTTAILVAGGPSITVEQEQMVKEAHAAGKCRLLVVNNMWERFPDADVLYAADGKWWDKHWPAVQAGFHGECWTRHHDAARQYGLCHIGSRGLPGLSRDPKIIHENANGGYQLANLTRHFLWQHAPDDPVKQIVLVAYDMMHGEDGRRHSYEDHPEGWGNSTKPESWAPGHYRLYEDLRDEGIRLVNCSLRTALTIPRADLAEVLAAL